MNAAHLVKEEKNRETREESIKNMINMFIPQNIAMANPNLVHETQSINLAGLENRLEDKFFNHKIAVDRSVSQHFTAYLISVMFRVSFEIIFLILQYYLYGFKVPGMIKCRGFPCPGVSVDCFVSRSMEKTIFLNFMFGFTFLCICMNLCEVNYLFYVLLQRYNIFRNLQARRLQSRRVKFEKQRKRDLIKIRKRISTLDSINENRPSDKSNRDTVSTANHSKNAWNSIFGTIRRKCSFYGNRRHSSDPFPNSTKFSDTSGAWADKKGNSGTSGQNLPKISWFKEKIDDSRKIMDSTNYRISYFTNPLTNDKKIESAPATKISILEKLLLPSSFLQQNAKSAVKNRKNRQKPKARRVHNYRPSPSYAASKLRQIDSEEAKNRQKCLTLSGESNGIRQKPGNTLILNSTNNLLNREPSGNTTQKVLNLNNQRKSLGAISEHIGVLQDPCNSIQLNRIDAITGDSQNKNDDLDVEIQMANQGGFGDISGGDAEEVVQEGISGDDGGGNFGFDSDL